MEEIQHISNNVSTDPATWVDMYGDYLYRFALSRLRNPERAENAVQETFLAALKARKSFSGRSSEKTWLVGILKHKIIDIFRSQYREVPVTDLQVESEQETINGFFDQAGHTQKKASDWLANPRDLAGNNEFWAVLKNCLAKLPKTASDVFTLREIDKLSTKEICKICGITSTNVWVILHRARLQLRNCLETNWFEK